MVDISPSKIIFSCSYCHARESVPFVPVLCFYCNSGICKKCRENIFPHFYCCNDEKCNTCFCLSCKNEIGKRYLFEGNICLSCCEKNVISPDLYFPMNEDKKKQQRREKRIRQRKRKHN